MDKALVKIGGYLLNTALDWKPYVYNGNQTTATPYQICSKWGCPMHKLRVGHSVVIQIDNLFDFISVLFDTFSCACWHLGCVGLGYAVGFL